MGRSHSKAEKSPPTINEKALLSPRLKRHKLKKENDRRKPKKFAFGKKQSKLDGLKASRPPMYLDPDDPSYEADLESEIKRKMQDQLAFNSDIFVLNQMMMSVQFFANYER